MNQSKVVIEIGEDLYGISIDELEERIITLRTEINRLEHELDKKKQERSAADSLFGKK